MKKFIKNGLALILISVSVFSLFACGTKNSTSDLEGTWILISDHDRDVEFTKDKMRFNHFVYTYEVKGNTIYFQECFPNRGHSGKMTYSIKKDTLTLDLGDMDGGYFHGQIGTAKLKRPESIIK